MKYAKVMFLDVDGVINTEKYYFSKFDEECVERIKRIVEATQCKIVISSSWREGDLSKTKKHFPEWMQEHIVDETVRGYKFVSKGSSLPIVRGNEIKHWVDRNMKYPWHANPEMTDLYSEFREDGSFKIMKSNKLNVDYTYVILDDDTDMLLEQASQFVQTDSYKGINDLDVEKAISILNKL